LAEFNFGDFGERVPFIVRLKGSGEKLSPRSSAVAEFGINARNPRNNNLRTPALKAPVN
jgi:hypothetical protein